MLATSSLSSQISPEVGRSRQPIKFTKVDLPEPEGPMIAIHSPGSTLREKLSSARMTPPLASAFAGYRRLTFFSLIISLPSQDHSGLDAPQQKNRKHGGNQGHNDAAHEDHGQNVEARHHRRMKVYSANPCGDTHADAESDDRPYSTQRSGFSGEESADQAFRRAQRFHNGKVAAAIEYPSDQCREHTQGCGRDNQGSSGSKRSASFSQHARLTFHDLTDGTDFGCGNGLRKLSDQSVDVLGRTRSCNLNGRRFHSRPAFE